MTRYTRPSSKQEAAPIDNRPRLKRPRANADREAVTAQLNELLANVTDDMPPARNMLGFVAKARYIKFPGIYPFSTE